jgi:dephospho-CoA kinase
MKYQLIGLTGTNGAGKGEVAAYLMENGYTYRSLSDEIREVLKKSGREITRDNLIATGNALRRRYGADILARRALKKVRGRAVIDSIRNSREVAFLRRQEGFVLVAVDAPIELRYKRVRRRGRQESASSLAEFIAKEKEELTGGPSGQQLRRCLARADFTIWNDGPRAALRRKVRQCLM